MADATTDSSRLWRSLEIQGERSRQAAEQLARLETRLEQAQDSLDRLTSGKLVRCAEAAERMSQLERRLTEQAQAPGSRPSCVEHESRLGFLEAQLTTLCSRLWWLATTVAAGVLMLTLRSVWDLLTV